MWCKCKGVDNVDKVENINCRNNSRPKFLRPWLNNISQMLKSKTIVSILISLPVFDVFTSIFDLLISITTKVIFSVKKFHFFIKVFSTYIMARNHSEIDSIKQLFPNLTLSLLLIIQYFELPNWIHYQKMFNFIVYEKINVKYYFFNS